ncbi:MAG TPA: helix-turn-helix domain-containing protein [Acidimicrobiales bacterium]
MQRVSFREMNCSVAQALEVVGEWWSLLIVRDALLGVTRFDEFHHRLGISRNVLNERLGRLVDEGVLDKVAYQDHPPRYDYVLTEKGRDLWDVLDAMRRWGDRWAPPAEGPPMQLVHRSCGHHTTPSLRCSECDEPLTQRDVTLVYGPGADDRSPSLPGRTSPDGS